MADKGDRDPATAAHTNGANGTSDPCARRRSGSSRVSQTFAALDLGTNNCRMLIARPDDTSDHPGAFRVVDSFSRITRLGEGLSANGQLSKDAMDRTVDALKSVQKKCSAAGS